MGIVLNVTGYWPPVFSEIQQLRMSDLQISGAFAVPEHQLRDLCRELCISPRTSSIPQIELEVASPARTSVAGSRPSTSSASTAGAPRRLGHLQWDVPAGSWSRALTTVNSGDDECRLKCKN